MPRPQYTPQRLHFAQKWAQDGLSDAEIVEKLRAGGAKGFVEGTLRLWWRKYGGRPAQGAPIASISSNSTNLAPRPAPVAQNDPPEAPHVPPELLEEPDTTPMTPEALIRALTGLLRHQERLMTAMTRDGDHAGAQRATRVAAQIAALLQKQQARDEEDGDTVRVRQTDLAAAAERARSKLHDLVARLSAERSR